MLNEDLKYRMTGFTCSWGLNDRLGWVQKVSFMTAVIVKTNCVILCVDHPDGMVATTIRQHERRQTSHFALLLSVGRSREEAKFLKVSLYIFIYIPNSQWEIFLKHSSTELSILRICLFASIRTYISELRKHCMSPLRGLVMDSPLRELQVKFRWNCAS